MTLHPLTGEVLDRGRRALRLPGHPLRRRARADGARDRRDRDRARGAAGRARAAGQAARGAAAAHAHHVRPRDDAAGRASAPASRTTPGTSTAATPGSAPHTPARLLPRGLPAGHRRVPRHGPADRRDVRGRHVPQAHAGRPRLPAAERDGQPAAASGRSSSSGSGRRSTCRRRPGRTSCGSADGVVEQIIRPTGLVDPRGRSSSRPRARSTTWSHEIRDRAASATSACWSPR